MLHLSQSHLTLIDTCARKYEHVFFHALSGPSSYEQHTKTQWGSQFHLLMQQQALDLPVEAIAAADTDMAASLQALEQAAPEVFQYLPVSQATDTGAAPSDSTIPETPTPQTFSQSEHRRTLTFNGYLLTVIYDLVVLSSQPHAALSQGPSQDPSQEFAAFSRGQIFDWKTHQTPPRKVWVAEDWQTRLYRYVLCETTSLTPEQISMTYWFVRVDESAKTKPSFYRFDYSQKEHEETRQELKRLTTLLTEMRSHNHFPKAAIEKGLCEHCAFNARCDRLPVTASNPQNQDPNRLLKAARQVTVETVDEVSL